MPAVSSSPISAALEQLSRLPASDRALLSGRCPGLAEYLARVPDPRNRRVCTEALEVAVLLCRTVTAWPSQTVKLPTWPALAQVTRAATRVSNV